MSVNPLLVICSNGGKVENQSYDNLKVVDNPTTEYNETQFFNQCLLEFPQSLLFFINHHITVQDEDAMLKVVNYWVKYSNLGSVLYTDGHAKDYRFYGVVGSHEKAFNIPFFFNNYVVKNPAPIFTDGDNHYRKSLEGLRMGGFKLVHYPEPTFYTNQTLNQITVNLDA